VGVVQRLDHRADNVEESLPAWSPRGSAGPAFFTMASDGMQLMGVIS